jgi:cell division protein FtsQ
MSRRAPGSRRVPPAAGVAAPADKRFRRSDVRPARRRLGQTLVLVVRWGFPALAALAVCAWAVETVMHSQIMIVQHLTVRGNQRLSTGQVESLVEGLRGQNIFQVDFDRYRERIMESPWVADVTLSRVLPSTIVIRVTERTPMAVARLGPQLYLLDDTGVIIDEYGAAYHDLDLPIVDGLLASAPAGGPRSDADSVRLADVLLTSLGTRADLGRRLSQVDVSNAHDAVVMFDDDPAWLHLGDEQFTERLNTYLELVPTLRERFHDIDYVDLRFGERVFVHARGRSSDVVRAGE